MSIQKTFRLTDFAVEKYCFPPDRNLFLDNVASSTYLDPYTNIDDACKLTSGTIRTLLCLLYPVV